MDDLKKWIGKKFLDFCKPDPDDEREIHYEMMTGDVSEKLEFTSRDTVSMKVMEQIRKSIITDIKLTDNWWHVSLKYKEEADMQEITMSKMERLEAEKEEFKQMYAECFPHLAIVADVLKKFGEERGIQTGGASIYIAPNGYISMGNLSEGWSLSRLNRESKPEIKCEVKEEIEEV